jgi:hypothetical protein
VIDPVKLKRQQSTVAVLSDHRYSDGGAPEVKCRRCAKRTRDQDGLCGRCRAPGRLPNPKLLTTEVLTAHLAACRVELRRRQDEIAAALGGEA